MWRSSGELFQAIGVQGSPGSRRGAAPARAPRRIAGAAAPRWASWRAPLDSARSAHSPPVDAQQVSPKERNEEAKQTQKKENT